jgi:hypothetical protein
VCVAVTRRRRLRVCQRLCKTKLPSSLWRARLKGSSSYDHQLMASGNVHGVTHEQDMRPVPQDQATLNPLPGPLFPVVQMGVL